MTSSDGRFRIWFERLPPPEYDVLLEGTATIVGSAAETPEDPFAAIGSAHAIIASSRLRYASEVMDRVPGLRVISRTGIGLDNISVADASARRIAVCYAPDGPTVSTAEHALALLLAVAKRLKRSERVLRQGEGDHFNDYDGIELDGLSMGLVGLGQIGSRMAAFGQALGMRVIAFDPLVDPARAVALGATLLDTLEELLATADVISLHAPLTEETQYLIDARRLEHVKAGAILINAARGGLVDEGAVLEALERGTLRGVGLDVFDPEPPDPDNPLLAREDVVATPHVAGATAASRDRLWRAAITQALQVLRGERPSHLANPDVRLFTEAPG